MYTITLANDTIFHGGTLQDSRWNKIPDINITKWEYNLFNKPIILSGYEEYNHLIERVYINASPIITKIILMGKINDEVHSITFDLKTKQLIKSVSKAGQEYNSKPVTGWKKGEKSLNPTIKLS